MNGAFSPDRSENIFIRDVSGTEGKSTHRNGVSGCSDRVFGEEKVAHDETDEIRGHRYCRLVKRRLIPAWLELHTRLKNRFNKNEKTRDTAMHHCFHALGGRLYCQCQCQSQTKGLVQPEHRAQSYWRFFQRPRSKTKMGTLDCLRTLRK